jgi:hypothetical protein
MARSTSIKLEISGDFLSQLSPKAQEAYLRALVQGDGIVKVQILKLTPKALKEGKKACHSKSQPRKKQ